MKRKVKKGNIKMDMPEDNERLGKLGIVLDEREKEELDVEEGFLNYVIVVAFISNSNYA